MNKLIIAMIITNLFVVTQWYVDRKEMQQEKLNKQICLEELIPITDFEIIGD